ncbi:MAG: hypothetical protein PHG05_03035 [Candidatus Nanoarchaeia archaeon]|nr:hypothetical protein [Candidatus Nanoarchaeia archaeon]
MVDKKGVIKTFEAVLAITMILLFIYTLLPREAKSVPEVPYEVDASFNYIINQVLTNNSLRNCVVRVPECRNMKYMQDLILNGKPVNYEFAYVICNTPTCLCEDTCVNFKGKDIIPGCNDLCVNSAPWPDDKNIYMGDAFVASHEDYINEPKIFRLWLWEK